MRIKFLLLLTFLLTTSSLFAQTTNLTLQVTDIASQTWNNGTWSVLLLAPSGRPATFFNIGTTTPVPNQSQSGALSSSGAATMTLTQNAGIAPANSTWQFTVCSQTTSIGGCFVQSATITSTATLTITPPPPVVIAGIAPGAVAYADSEVLAGIGQIYYNTVSQTNRVCQAATGNTCTTWAVAGGSGLPAGALIGQVPVYTGSSTATPQSLGVPLCNGGAVIAATPYTLLADSGTATRDRTSLCAVSTSGAGTFHVPAGSTTGVGTGFPFGFLNDGAGTWTVDNNASSDTFNITNGSTKTDAASSFTVTTGQHFSITNSGVSNGSGGVIWYVRSVTGGGAGNTYYATPLTAATGQWSGWALAGAGVSGTTNTGSWSKAGASDWSYTDAAATAQGQTTVSVADPVWMANASTSATANTAQGWFDGSQADHVFGVSQTFASLGGISVTTNARYCMLMLSSGTLGHCTNNDSPCVTAIGDKCVGFQYSTNRSDTNWQCIVGNGTTQTTTSTGVAADTNTHRWEIQLAAAAATFFIDGVQVCNGMSMTNFPASGTGFSPLIGVQDLTASAITIRTIGVVWQTNTAH